MKILAAVANYGNGNQGYLQQVLAALQAVGDTRCVVLSNIPKTVPAGVELRVGLPSRNPMSLPFAHRRLFAERVESFDLFIYTEDDTLVTGRNVRAFCDASSVLPDGALPGFVRSETAPDGTVYCSTANHRFHWDTRSVFAAGGLTFARFTNDHSGAYIITRAHLRRAIQSGGFCVPPHESPYGMLESAATDIYTRCGMRKFICLDRLRDFTLPHLPNKYIGRMGIRIEELEDQIRALRQVHAGEIPPGGLVETETRAAHAMGSKAYYEPVQADLLDMLPSSARTLLSVGCGWGETEAEALRRGMDVTAVPLDSAIAASARRRGVAVVYGDWPSARGQLSGRRFDVLLVSGLLHLMPDPVGFLAECRGLLEEHGVVAASVPNLARLPVLVRRFLRQPGYRSLDSFEVTGMHPPSLRAVGAWFRKAGLQAGPVRLKLPEQLPGWGAGLPKPMESLVADKILLLGRPVKSGA